MDDDGVTFRSHLDGSSHLFITGEVLGLRLATIHNLRFYLRLMADIRAAIREGRFREWSRDFLGTYEGGEE